MYNKAGNLVFLLIIVTEGEIHVLLVIGEFVYLKNMELKLSILKKTKFLFLYYISF